MLHYRELGKDVFRTSAGEHTGRIRGARPLTAEASFDVAAVLQDSEAREAEIWETMVGQRRKVSRADYEALAAAAPRAERAPGTFRVAVGEDPSRVGRPAMREKRREARGRRPSHAHNATKA
jgi:hypothetical protein